MLTLRCGEATLRLATPADDDTLVALLPDDFDHDPTFPRSPGTTLAQHREAWLRHWLDSFRRPHPADYFLPFVVEADGAPVGFQVLEAPDFERQREVDSSSFLAPAARGRRLGVAMRTAVLALAFDVMGAERAVTSADPGNVASQRVTERVGYRPAAATNDAECRTLTAYELTAERWRTLDALPVEIDGEVPHLAQDRRLRALAARVLGGEALDLVWRNHLGGLTFAAGDRFAKVQPLGAEFDPDADAARLTWAARWLPVPVPLDHGRTDGDGWLVTRRLPGADAIDERFAGRAPEVCRELGRALRHLHDTLPLADCPWTWDPQPLLDSLPTEARASLGPRPEPDLVVCHGDAAMPNVLLDDDARCVGYLDLGNVAVADRHEELAELYRSVRRNVGAQHWAHVLTGYGRGVDEAAVAYYVRLADELSARRP